MAIDMTFVKYVANKCKKKKKMFSGKHAFRRKIVAFKHNSTDIEMNTKQNSTN